MIEGGSILFPFRKKDRSTKHLLAQLKYKQKVEPVVYSRILMELPYHKLDIEELVEYTKDKHDPFFHIAKELIVNFPQKFMTKDTAIALLYSYEFEVSYKGSSFIHTLPITDALLDDMRDIKSSEQYMVYSTAYEVMAKAAERLTCKELVYIVANLQCKTSRSAYAPATSWERAATALVQLPKSKVSIRQVRKLLDHKEQDVRDLAIALIDSLAGKRVDKKAEAFISSIFGE